MTKYSPETTRITGIRHLTNSYCALRLGPFSRTGRCRPGQFLHLRLPHTEVYFRRAMSIAAAETDRAELEIIFKVFGRGTAALAGYKRGDQLDVLGPLGVPFKKPRKNEMAIMIGGGVGFPPLMFLAHSLVADGFDPKAIHFYYGGRDSDEIVERNRFKKMGIRFSPVTDDGSFGQRGLVTDAVEADLVANGTTRRRIYACGPEAMLKAADDLGTRYSVPGQLSLEAPMPCGYGVCLGCVVPLRVGGHARVCVEGPVFNIGEVLL